jgi:hypothetical protein
VEYLLPALAIVAGCALAVAIAAWVISGYRDRKLVREAAEWPTTEARVETGELESVHESGKAVLPTFAFSYQAGGESYSGKFALLPKRAFFPTEARHVFIESLIAGMIGRKMMIRCNPRQPEMWFIPDEMIDGCKVEQRIGFHMIRDYSPSD